MFGCIDCRPPGAPPFRMIEGVRFRTVSVAPGKSFRAGLSARAAARTLRREGVRLAVFPPDCAYRAVFAKHGIAAPPLAPLYRAAAAGIVTRYLAQRGVEARRALLTFAADCVTPELCRCVRTLCADVRYIALAVPRGGALAQALRRDFGVAAQVGPLDALLRADLIVTFDDTPAEGAVLRLDERLRVVFDSEHPNELLALLWRAGALDAASLRVRDVILPAADE